MKTNKAMTTTIAERPSRRVVLKFDHATAKSVSIAGTFNDWRPGASEMLSVGNGRWFKELVLPPGTYEYRFIADGEWMADPLVPETIPNPFGGVNSILIVPHISNAGETKSRAKSRNGSGKT
jgi:hypothetical protein